MTDVKEQEFLDRLRATFRVEAEEHLQALSTCLIELEKTSEPARQSELVESALREAHSLKGAARSVNLKDIEAVCQPLESLLVKLKRQEGGLSPDLFDLLHQAVDGLREQVNWAPQDRTSADRARARDLSQRLAKASQGKPASASLPPGLPDPPEALREAQPASGAALMEAAVPDLTEGPTLAEGLNALVHTDGPASALAETVRIPISKFDPLLLQAEEMIQAKLAAVERTVELHDIEQELLNWKTESARWRDARAGQPLELAEWMIERIDTLAIKVSAVSRAIDQDQRALRHRVDIYLDAMKQLLILPVSILVEGFPRLVRDLARDQGKDVDLYLSGTEIEIDKRILEQLKDPLIHLVRNCVDHGIEMPAVRARRGKPVRGSITLAFSSKDGRQVEILVTDDGAGIDLHRVKDAALKAGFLVGQADDQATDQNALPMIFQSGLSTSAILTDVSGRGLGLAIVREKVEKLGGNVSVDSRAGLGVAFRIVLPLTLATFRGVLVRAREQTFVLPTARVERVVRVRRDEIRTIENRETIQLDGQVLALVRLADLLGLPERGGGFARLPAQAVHVPILILELAEKRLALEVDDVLAEEEVLVKGLGRQLQRVRHISGATVLGAGNVVPVLNVSDLMSSAVRPGGQQGAPAGNSRAAAQTGRILVADDSITARTLLKNILEMGGHQVTTAVDGADAFTKLSSAEFDLLVSDVDMPFMSGFELTTKVRAHKELSELPVVLVTSLEARQDRERGIEVGANAYLIKSSFDQSNLLEVVHRLL